MTTFESAHLGSRYLLQAGPTGLSDRQDAVRRRLLGADRGEDWELVDCICGAGGGRILTDVDRHGLPYRKVLCSACGLMRVTPRWTATRYSRFYQDDYRDLYSPLSDAAGVEALRAIADGPGARLVSEFVEAAWHRFGNAEIRNPVVVEIGAGGGWNLSRLTRRWVKIGYDVDERFLEQGRSLFGLDMRKGLLPEALQTVATADCVLLSHVLEHVPDPVSTLRLLASTARPDALLLVEVPGIFRLHKTSLDPMRYWQNAHTFTFCARTVVDTCRRAGLEPLSVDEWVRLVLRPSAATSGPVNVNASIARSVERYLRFCEFGSRVARYCSQMPVVGAVAARVARRCTDGLVRIASGLKLVAGIRSGAIALRR